MMRKLLSSCLLISLLFCYWPLNAQIGPLSIDLSEQERDWIAAHPVLRVGVFEDFQPFEYISKGELRGLTANYLHAISRHTGLRFVSVVTTTDDAHHAHHVRQSMLLNGEVDILPGRLTFASHPPDPGVLYTRPYSSSSIILVSRFSDEPFVDLEHLAGKRIVISEREGCAPLLMDVIPGAVLIPANNAADMLKMVDEGQADTAIAAEWLLIPYITRQYRGALKVSGIAPALHAEVSMAVRESDEMLLSILEKTLVFINRNERKVIYDDWLDEMDLDIPTIEVIVEHFGFEIWLLLAVLLLLLMLAWQARALRIRAMRRHQDKAMFLAVMSHEVRSPMNAVLAAVELLQYSPIDNRQRKFIDLVVNAANKILGLVDEVLDLCKIEAKKLQLAPVPVDIESLVQRVLNNNRLAAEQKGLTLMLASVAPIPTLLLDDLRVEQAFHNLVSSAIQATTGGEIELQLQALDEEDGEYVLLRLTSTDVALSKELQCVLRSSTARVKSTSGGGYYTELGLVISRKLVKLMNGNIVLAGHVDGRTCVDVILPMTRAPFISPESISGQNSDVTLVEKDAWVQVLVVEEATVHRHTLIGQLLGAGCSVLSAENITQGLTLFRECPVDLVLFDWSLLVHSPDSIQAYREKLYQQQRLCPFIAMRCLEERPYFGECFDAEMEGVLSKPVQQEQLQQMIEMWCGPPPVSEPKEVHEEQAPEDCPEFREALDRLVEAVALRDSVGVTRALHFLRETWPRNDVIAQVGDAMDVLLLSADSYWPAEAFAQHLSALLEHRVKA